ncbi:MAG TPA: 6-phosphofructokinase [Aggregatilineales bacterium]|nr:6-phosphofructokinase [Anaerolineae bacterium]HUN08677.1 6-phosphofructokinase [Aggregatilineales bacterium]
MKSIAVLTSGGDAPGMNAAIRAVTRTALTRGWDVYGVQHGFAGLMSGDLKKMGPRDVGGIIQQGGTVLGSARAPEFKSEEGRKKALRHLNQLGIEGLVVIGGNGSQTGGEALFKMGFPVVGVASTIDNDLVGSEITIGVDTALNIALEAIDRLKVTASSHNRAFLVEVMGRDCGYLALMSGIAGGAEAILIPEMEKTPAEVAEILKSAYAKGKAHAIIVVAEGCTNNADELIKYFKEREAELGFEIRAIQLGHVQRGGTPGAFDRLLATRLGAAAVKSLDRGEYGVIVGLNKGQITTTPYTEVTGKHKSLDLGLMDLAKELDG